MPTKRVWVGTLLLELFLFAVGHTANPSGVLKHTLVMSESTNWVLKGRACKSVQNLYQLISLLG